MNKVFNYKKKASKVLEDLRENKRLKVEVAKINKPVSADTKNSLPLRHISVPQGLIDFYDQCDGIHLAWREKKNKPETGNTSGEIGIVSLAETFIFHWKDKLWFDWMDGKSASEGQAQQYELAKTIKGFDVMDVILDKTLIISLLLPEKNTTNESDIKLYYWDNKGIKFPINMTPSAYIEKSLEYYGMLRWQLFYIDFEKIDLKKPVDQEMFGKSFHTLLEPMQEFIEDYDRLFPGKEDSFLKKQLNVTRQFGRDSGLNT